VENYLSSFFSPEAGQARRAWLDRQTNALMYYVPPEMRPQLDAIAGMTPVAAYGDSVAASRRMMADGATPYQRGQAAGDMAAGVLGIVAPGYIAGRAGAPLANALGEVVMGYSAGPRNALADFGAAEDGGIRLWHGSPHDWKAERLVRMPDGSTQYIEGMPDVLPDVPRGATVIRDYPLGRVRMDKIGTGEGAQAYGHGWYGAEQQGVGKGYRDALSGGNVEARNFFRDGAMVPDIGEVWQGGYDAAKAASPMHPDAARAIANQVQEWVAAGKKPETFLRFNQPPKGYEPAYEAAVRAWSGVTYKKNPGRLYEVDVAADPADFLDWDMPLPADHPLRREIVGYAETAMQSSNAMDRNWAKDAMRMAESADLTGQGAHYQMTRLLDANRDKLADTYGDGAYLNKSTALASQEMKAKGIPGIRYLDRGSRGAGDGSRNYVVFDDNLITILKKYMIPGAAVSGAIAASPEDGRSQMQYDGQGNALYMLPPRG
jgi:hypothetical protein